MYGKVTEKEPEINIEAATVEDAAAIAHIQKEGWLATYPNEEHGITEEDILSKDFESEERIQRRIERLKAEGETTQTWIARQSGRVIGYSSAVRGDEINKVVSVYLLPECQGKGLGSRLLRQALEWLGDEKDISLGVVPYNKTAIQFYEKFGFRLGGPVPHDVPTFATGKDMPEIEMTRLKAVQ